MYFEEANKSSGGWGITSTRSFIVANGGGEILLCQVSEITPS